MLKDLLSGYAPLEGRYDELLAAPDTARPHWAAFVRSLAQRAGPDVVDTLSLTERQIREHGITYNVYADPKGADRPWEVDPLPLLLSAAEWREIEDGIAQRADLLNRVLIDIYGEQSLLRSGAIPPPVIFGHSGFLHPLLGVRPPVHLMLYAADLARSPDGRWWVVSDRTQAPSGAGYALENRLVVSRHLSADVSRAARRAHGVVLRRAARVAAALGAEVEPGEGAPLIVLLTPGPYNETYFEHALLARYLGFALVEGNDLTVRDGCVWMKTIDGLKRVHAIVRRQDDDYCDPLELRSDSALGVAGLTDCARRGTVLLGNALGSGVLESGALLGYLPKLSRQLLGEPLKLPSVATGGSASRRHSTMPGSASTSSSSSRSNARCASRPCSAPTSAPTSASCCARMSRRARSATSRRNGPCVAGAGARTRAAGCARRAHRRPARLRGGDAGRLSRDAGRLTRVAVNGESRVIAMQRGGRSKGHLGAVGRAGQRLVLADLDDGAARRPRQLARQPAVAHGREPVLVRPLRRTLRQHRAPAARRDRRRARARQRARRRRCTGARAGATPAHRRFARRSERRSAARRHPSRRSARRAPAPALARRLQPARPHVGRQLAHAHQLASDPVFTRGAALPLALAWLDRAVTSMMTLSGFVLDGMTRSAGWRFLSIGRRVERLANLATALQVATQEGRAHGLDWLLELCDSSGTYRSRYMVAPEWLPVLDLLLRDDTNPRSIAFQVKGLSEYVAKFEASHGRFASDVVAPCLAALKALTPADLDPESEVIAALLEQLRKAAGSVSDELSLKFFSHAMSRSVLSLVA